MATKKKVGSKTEFTVKKTGYILKRESIKDCLESMCLTQSRLNHDMMFILPSLEEFHKEVGNHETPKKVNFTVTVKMEEI